MRPQRNLRYGGTRRDSQGMPPHVESSSLSHFMSRGLRSPGPAHRSHRSGPKPRQPSPGGPKRARYPCLPISSSNHSSPRARPLDATRIAFRETQRQAALPSQGLATRCRV
ncbi:hypothetical protein BJV77DRAFT_123279 [Russula vinacea]|nr:hypothetical protein BJV77DRAFT_123279 [Russula vinacea]